MDVNSKLERFEDTDLDEKSLISVKFEINENEEEVTTKLNLLKKLLSDLENLNANTNDEFLLRFLRGSKFDVDKAFSRIRNYYSVRKKRADLFERCYPTALPLVQDADHSKALPFRMHDHSAVLIHEQEGIHLETIPFEEYFLMDVLIMEYILENPITQRCGLSIIMDYKGYNLQKFLSFTPQRLRLCADTFQNSYPVRIRRVHVVNAPRLVSLLYNMAYPFLTKKLRSRFVIHSSSDKWKSLHSVFPPEILPERYGGQLKSSDIVDLVGMVVKRDNYYREQLQYGFCDASQN
ncbi:retinaldehyde-binding protein 1-like [Uloborus diversus]|uniref:retinaldehyde-binding protein 1-like n=1 Tax=Uloborus diversus TaxID=327109 RepID=UPI00240A620E|nr:retinaldehyde-binding protein 1-like [Uloborus diversus]XP_054707760.1 retinaldehyde-binding protein 1-like [Uloborus diversus]